MDAGVSHAAISWLDRGLWKQRRRLRTFLDMDVKIVPPLGKCGEGAAWVGWGRKRSGLRALKLARRHQMPYLLLEDGFLRSFGLGVCGYPPLSVVVDRTGVHYDATAPSDLENMLRYERFSDEEKNEAERILSALREQGLSKYNTGLPVPEGAFPSDEERVLVVDQTAGDLSLKYGLTDERTFPSMLEAALDENPGATVYVKTHPDVLAGHRRGCLPFRQDARIRWIAENWHPHDLLRQFGKVYVATSLMGFDALVLGREVHCFGMPFYAGWGLTRDRRKCGRRGVHRSLVELVAAGFLRYARYMDPETGRRGDFFSVARHVARQRRKVAFWSAVPGATWSGRVYAFGFRIWKQAQVKPFFGQTTEVTFCSSVDDAKRHGIGCGDRLAVWGMRDPEGLAQLAESLETRIVRVEDGFLRSMGLGSDFIPPLSLVFDDLGIYFDPSSESRLERILNTTSFDEDVLERARTLREFLVDCDLTKYNFPGHPGRRPEPEMKEKRKIILVPGQVEDDASVIRGGGEIRTNIDLLKEVRSSNPNAFIIYKPHPDVLAGNRKGRAVPGRTLADMVISDPDIVPWINIADEIHTMTSLSGFDALLRGKKVVTYGLPFYAGWGLTEDRMEISRRRRKLLVDELVAGVLILYPDYHLRGVEGMCDAYLVARNLCEAKSRSSDFRWRRNHQRFVWLAKGVLSSIKRNVLGR